MKNKLLISIFLLIFMCAYSHSSNLRLNSMSGFGNFNLNLLKDYWCDSMLVNPSYMSETSSDITKYLLNSFFDLNLLGSYLKKSLSYSSDNKYFFGNTNCQLGFIFPFKNFNFGFNSNLILNGEYDSYSSYDLNRYSQNINIDLFTKFLFSWDINRNIKFGFDIGAQSVIYNSGEYNNINGEQGSLGKKPFDLKYMQTLGFIIKNDKLNISISFPQELRSYLSYDENYFDKNLNNWSIRDDYYFANSEGKVVIDFIKNDYLSFRIPIDISAQFAEFGYIDDPAYCFDRILKSKEDSNYLTFPIKAGFSISNHFSNKNLLYFGFDSEFIPLINTITLSLSYDNFTILNRIGTLIGSEIYINEKISIRLGFNISIFSIQYSEYKNEGLDNDKILNYSFLNNLKFNTGLLFNITKTFSLEFNADCLVSNLSFNINNTSYIDYASEVVKYDYQLGDINFSIKFGFIGKL